MVTTENMGLTELQEFATSGESFRKAMEKLRAKIDGLRSTKSHKQMVEKESVIDENLGHFDRLKKSIDDEFAAAFKGSLKIISEVISRDEKVK